MACFQTKGKRHLVLAHRHPKRSDEENKQKCG